MGIGAQIGRIPLGAGSDLPFMNYSGTDIPQGIAVALDTTNLLGGSNLGYGAVLPAADGGPVLGVTVEVIKAGGAGRVQVAGIGVGTANGAITAGWILMADGTTAGKHGTLKQQTAGKYQVGIALATVADGDPVPFLVALANNA